MRAIWLPAHRKLMMLMMIIIIIFGADANANATVCLSLQLTSQPASWKGARCWWRRVAHQLVKWPC